ALVPAERLAAGGVPGQVEADQAGPLARLAGQGVEVEAAVGVVGDDRVRRALVADATGQGAGVHAGQADHAAHAHPGVQPALGAPVGRVGRQVAEDGAPGRGLGGAADLLDVLEVGPDVADVG